MGKPSPPQAAPARESIPLHTPPRRHFYDDDAPELDLPQEINDLPPLYNVAAEASTSINAPLLSEPPHSGAQTPRPGLSTLRPFRHDENIDYYLDSTLDTNPEVLESHVRAWAATPPRPFVRIRGSHHEARSEHGGKRVTRDVVDFDVRVELTPYVCPDGGVGLAGRVLRTAGNAERTRRGTVLRTRAPAAGRAELGVAAEPSLAQWCHMYCASHAALKVFQLKRSLGGFDAARVRDHLCGLVHRLNYRGHVQISFPVQDEVVEVWSDCAINRWRLTHWVCAVVYISMLWVLTWPLLFLSTKRFETVSAVWNYSALDVEGRRTYTTISEDQWYNLWGRALSRAILSKRQGTLDQRDLLAADSPLPPLNPGSAIAHGALGLMVAGLDAMNEVNRHLGWGEDQS